MKDNTAYNESDFTKDNLNFIIYNKATEKNKYYLRDFIIMLLAWGAWGLILMQPTIHSWNKNGDYSFSAYSYSFNELIVIIFLVFLSISLVIFAWSGFQIRADHLKSLEEDIPDHIDLNRNFIFNA